MEISKRKEIIQFNGLTILVGMVFVANFLVVGLVYRWHNYKLFMLEKKQNIEYTKLLGAEHRIKNEVVQLEDASSWNGTAYVRALGKNLNAP